jgi:hypothetical protein
MFPGSPLEKVSVPYGKNVDEFISLHWQGGPGQVEGNQWLMNGQANQLVGDIEARAARGVSPGTRILGFDLIWLP